MALNKIFTRTVKSAIYNVKTSHLAQVPVSGFLISSRSISAAYDSDVVYHDIVNNKGILILNKPEKLNSMFLKDATSILYKLLEWEKRVDMVIVKGEGRAFSSGGDIVQCASCGLENPQPNKDLLKTIYTVNAVISQYPVPYVSLIDGITMGTGFGLSIHGPARVATERTAIAMPEAGVGMFADNGSCYIYSRLPHHLGYFLGLTCHRIKGTDALKIGFATHYVKSENIPTILQGLKELDDPKENLNAFLSERTEDLSDVEFSLEPYIEIIDKAFSAPTVEEICENLKMDGSKFALQALGAMKKNSPSSLKYIKSLIDIYKNKTLMEGLDYEYRVAVAVIDGKLSLDFYEGAIATLVDKRKPNWNPATLEEITDEMVNSIYNKLSPENEFNFDTTISEVRKKLQL